MGLLTQPRSASADQWFKMLEDTHTNLNRDRMDELSEDEIEGLVKIAILDTGVDLSHEAFKKFVENGQLDPGYDFVNRGEPMTDLEGHGTHCCHLVLKTAPYAKVYPLRVFRSSKREDATPELVKEVRESPMSLHGCNRMKDYVLITSRPLFTLLRLLTWISFPCLSHSKRMSQPLKKRYTTQGQSH